MAHFWLSFRNKISVYACKNASVQVYISYMHNPNELLYCIKFNSSKTVRWYFPSNQFSNKVDSNMKSTRDSWMRVLS